jgi:hypothetical protein
MTDQGYGTPKVDEPGEAAMTPEDEAHWKRWDAALERIIKHREDMERRGALQAREEIRQALDEMRGRCD